MSDSLDQFFPTAPAGSKPSGEGDGLDSFFPRSPGKPSSPKSLASRTASNIAAVGDLVLSLPAQGIGVGGDMGMRATALGHGLDHRLGSIMAAQYRQELTEKLGNPLQKLMNYFGFGEEYSGSDVSLALKKASTMLERGGEYVEKKTGGAINRWDVDSLVSTLLYSAGVRGTAKALQPKIDSLGRVPSPTAANLAADLRAAKAPAPIPADVRGRLDAKAAIEKSTGVSDQPTGKAREARQAEVRAAFKEDPQYADYLRNYAEEEVRLRGLQKPLGTPGAEPGGPRTPRTGSTDAAEPPKLPPASPPKVETGAKSTLDSALEKVRNERGFDLTAEERVALRDMQSAWRKPEIPTEGAGKARTAEEQARMETARGPASQRGAADQKLLANLAAVGIGAAVGSYLDPDNRLQGLILGTLGGAAATKASPARIASTFKALTSPDTRFRIGSLGDQHEYAIKKAGVELWKLQNEMIDAVPDAARRAAITHWIEGDKSIQLSNLEIQVAQKAVKMFADLRDAGFDAGVLKTARDNYVTHLWEWGKQDKSSIAKALEQKGGVGMSPRSPYAQERIINTLAEGKALGLTPKTEDIATIIGIYGNSMARSIANANLIRSLKAAKTPSGSSIILPAEKAPHTYVSINHPQLQGLRIHPDVESSMRFLFDARDPGVAARAIEGVNSALKRVAVSFSLFHNKALLDAYIASGVNPAKIPGKITGFLTAQDRYLRELRTMGVGPTIDKALKGGLEFSLEKTSPAVEDVGGAFYGAMEDLQRFLDSTVPGLGKPVEGVVKVNHAVDNVTWARMHAGMKLNTFAATYEKLLKNNAKAHAKDPTVRLLGEEEIAKIAASYTNDLFGGLNWRRIAEGAKTRWGRDLALGAFSPTGRRVMQLAMFAPDWTISTTRAALGAFGKGSGVKGLYAPQTLADLHRQYVLRSALYYAVVGDAINYAASGHHLWDNKDWTRIDLGDGRTMQWSKHTMEPVHWLQHPGQQALNKLGMLPRQAAEQALGVEYLSAKGKMPPMEGSRTEHLLKSVTPIAGQQAGDLGTGIAGFLGTPIYGKTEDQKLEERLRRRMKKLEEQQ